MPEAVTPMTASEFAGRKSVWRSDLGTLANPAHHTGPLRLKNVASEWLLSALAKMFEIRETEDAIARLLEEGEARGPCHLATGQEAIPVGVSRSLRPTDRVFGNHRSHGHYLSLGGSVFALLAEVMGRESGASRGRGGSMHVFAGDRGFLGAAPIVASTVPLAVGAGLAAKMDRRGDIGVCYFGDGACEEGVVHESLNLASNYRVPVLFVCENNLFSSHLDVGLRQSSDRMARLAEAHRVPAETIDGNDVVAVAEAAERMIARARAGGGPGFLEVVTYRWRGHVGPRDDIDVGLRRSASELVAWKRRDPIRRLVDALIARGESAEALAKIADEAERRVADALEAARMEPRPSPATLLQDVLVAPDHG
jgi:pyruvate dehydrogenase E1 component alpha subunit